MIEYNGDEVSNFGSLLLSGRHLPCSLRVPDFWLDIKLANRAVFSADFCDKPRTKRILAQLIVLTDAFL